MNQQSAVSLLLLLPLFAAFAILVLNRYVGSFVCKVISVGSATICLITSCLLLGAEPTAGTLFQFINVDGLHAGIGFILDQQSAGMMFIVTFIGLLVHVYSLGYMKEDESQSRFFGSLSMFMFSMTGIVLADNLLMMFVFWELVGLSSYLLIGHWFEHRCYAFNC